MNRAQAVLYLATICVCSPKACGSINEDDTASTCRACNTFRADPELSNRTSCVARTATYKRVRAGRYNGSRASWQIEKDLTDPERVQLARSGFDIVAPEER